MNLDEIEKFGRDEPIFQDEKNQYDGQDINRQFNDPRNDIDDEEDDDDDLEDIDEDSRDDDDYDDVDDDDLEKDGDLDDDDD